MPRVADHDERRALIARTFRRHLVEHGLQATTFARVAAAAGISVGLIQHYFGSRDELLRFVYVDALRRRDERIAAHIAAGEAAERPIREIIATAVVELLPLDAIRVEEFHVTQNLVTQALHDQALAEVAARAHRDLHLRASIAVRNGKRCGEVDGDVDIDTAAARILATTCGLAASLILVGPDDPARRRAPADAVIDPVLAMTFTGRCRHYARS
ncbi:TetR/AcrR family transcriptional regulator [Micromonospora sp. C51]|uniref:TetR/AcrR family transcriptional regulator n=1 Tax=Micromonospora sp. C51 TaxID=2824879 RepID=UPI001B36312D|nr:TetR/AcrR family transcriptional regulator [Micromonospora sp. C51]MBQ1048143.1 TetR/AcrR family transcriptional regulator [Micromonospora sp. C51]